LRLFSRTNVTIKLDLIFIIIISKSSSLLATDLGLSTPSLQPGAPKPQQPPPGSGNALFNCLLIAYSPRASAWRHLESPCAESQGRIPNSAPTLRTPKSPSTQDLIFFRSHVRANGLQTPNRSGQTAIPGVRRNASLAPRPIRISWREQRNATSSQSDRGGAGPASPWGGGLSPGVRRLPGVLRLWGRTPEVMVPARKKRWCLPELHLLNSGTKISINQKILETGILLMTLIS